MIKQRLEIEIIEILMEVYAWVNVLVENDGKRNTAETRLVLAKSHWETILALMPRHVMVGLQNLRQSGPPLSQLASTIIGADREKLIKIVLGDNAFGNLAPEIKKEDVRDTLFFILWAASLDVDDAKGAFRLINQKLRDGMLKDIIVGQPMYFEGNLVQYYSDLESPSISNRVLVRAFAELGFFGE